VSGLLQGIASRESWIISRELSALLMDSAILARGVSDVVEGVLRCYVGV
jgi:hypothetical protein